MFHKEKAFHNPEIMLKLEHRCKRSNILKTTNIYMTFSRWQVLL